MKGERSSQNGFQPVFFMTSKLFTKNLVKVILNFSKWICGRQGRVYFFLEPSIYKTNRELLKIF